jgi:hypothetical protein
MTAETLPRPADTGTGDDWTHAFCHCDPDVAICGADLAGYEDTDDSDDQLCPLCVVMLKASGGLCGRCGQ